MNPDTGLQIREISKIPKTRLRTLLHLQYHALKEFKLEYQVENPTNIDRKAGNSFECSY